MSGTKSDRTMFIVPPDGWAVVEANIYRAIMLTSNHISFLKSIGIKTVVNMATSNLRQANALQSAGINLFQPCASRSSQTIADDMVRSQISDEIAKEALQFILEPSNQPLVLTVATSGSLEVAALVGCLRRVQHWALTSILYEFRLYAPNSAIYDVNRQFIERFDISLITLPVEKPDWLLYEQELLEEEHRHRNVAVGVAGQEDDDRFYYYSKDRVPLTSEKVTKSQISVLVSNDDD